ncbi:MAG: VWA domain-containing protein, partial [candidate division Zixibacteria bacterium]|nr:VWA domain-containing protein [candidate division Zixibacteria bacterium]
MSNIIWLDEYDPLTDFSTPLLSQGKVVVFAKEADNCYVDHHRVSFQTGDGKVKLRYRNYTDSGEICSGSDYQTQWSEEDEFFYFDRSEGEFISQAAFNPTNPNHVRVFLPYATYSVDVEDTSQKATWYDYNYLNWIFYHSSQQQRDALKQMHDDPDKRELLTRIVTAKKAVKEVINSNEDVRFGLMRFDGTSGGQIVAEIPSDNKDLNKAIDDLWAGGGTPLAETLEDAWDYFSGGKSFKIDLWCRKNFVILMTDGQPTFDSNDLSSDMKKDWDGDSGGTEANGWEGDETKRYYGEGSDYLDDVAYYMYQNDGWTSLDGDQNVTTYTIGFTVSNQLLKDTAFNGNG